MPIILYLGGILRYDAGDPKIGATAYGYNYYLVDYSLLALIPLHYPIDAFELDGTLLSFKVPMA